MTDTTVAPANPAAAAHTAAAAAAVKAASAHEAAAKLATAASAAHTAAASAASAASEELQVITGEIKSGWQEFVAWIVKYGPTMIAVVIAAVAGSLVSRFF